MYGTGDVKLFSPEIKDDAVKVTVHDTAEGPGGALPVEMTREEAREWALELLTAAGPNSEDMVETWVAGKVRVTIEAPKGNEDVFDPFISVYAADTAAFERLLDVFGGLAAFGDIGGADWRTLTRTVEPLGSIKESMYVSVRMPQEMIQPSSALAPAALAMQKRQAELKERQVEEQAAAERIEAERAAAVEASHGPHPLAGTEGD